MGTDDLTLFDIHCGPMWEKVFLLEEGGSCPDVLARLNWRYNAPNWCAYVERFREHPMIKPYRFDVASHKKQCDRLFENQ